MERRQQYLKDMNSKEDKPRTVKLIIERYLCGDVKDELKKPHLWIDVADPRKDYMLSKLLEDGYTIENVALSTSRCCSKDGYHNEQDHTILTLTKTFDK